MGGNCDGMMMWVWGFMSVFWVLIDVCVCDGGVEGDVFDVWDVWGGVVMMKCGLGEVGTATTATTATMREREETMDDLELYVVWCVLEVMWVMEMCVVLWVVMN